MSNESTRATPASPSREDAEGLLLGEAALPLQPPLAVLLREGFRWFMDRLNDNADAAGEPRLSAAAGIVVSYLQPDGSRPADIARAMGVTRQHVHSVVRELTDAGVVRTVPDPVSRRDRLIVPTEGGESRRRRAVARLAALEAELGQIIGQGELEQLHQILARLWSPGTDGPTKRADDQIHLT
jgi:DNA-binding MarR family transcriptional regulator